MSSSSSSSRSRSPKKNKKRVYVTGYSLKEDQHGIKKLFKKFGKIEELAWKGKYCFIEFKEPSDAERAVRKMNREEINGYTLSVEMAKGNKPSKNNGICYSCGRQGHLQVINSNPYHYIIDIYINIIQQIFLALKIVDISHPHHHPVPAANPEENTKRRITRRRNKEVLRALIHLVAVQRGRRARRRRHPKQNHRDLHLKTHKTRKNRSLRDRTFKVVLPFSNNEDDQQDSDEVKKTGNGESKEKEKKVEVEAGGKA